MLTVSPGAGEAALSCARPYKPHNMKAASKTPRTAEILRLFTPSSYTSETRHLAKEEMCPMGPDVKSNSEWPHPAPRIPENAHSKSRTRSRWEPHLGGRAA